MIRKQRNKFAHIELDEKKLAEETLQYILKIQNTYLECTLYQEILDPRVKYGDLHQHISFLKERLSHLKFSVDYTDVYFENSVSGYTQFKYDIDGSKVDDSEVLLSLKNDIEGFSKEIFWANENEEKAYQSLSSFDSFVEIITSEKERLRKLLYSPFFNVESWISYYHNLLDLKFRDFNEKIMLGKTIIKYRPFKNEYFLGIESDYKECKDQFKRGWWETPDYKLIIFRKINVKKIERVVTFDKFIHPFLNYPAFDFKVFFAVITTHQVDENKFLLDNGTRTEYLDDGNVRLYNTNEVSERLKRHAYFYYDMLYHTTKEYIKFIEESFLPNEVD